MKRQIHSAFAVCLLLGANSADAADTNSETNAPTLTAALTIPAAHREVSDVATFGDMGVLFSVGQTREVKFWDLQTGRPVRELPMNTPGRALAFSPSGKLLAAGGGEFARNIFQGGITIWDTETWKEVRQISFTSADVNVLAFLDEKILVSAGLNGARVWNVETGNLEKHVPTDTAILAMDLSKDRTQFAIATFSTNCYLLDSKNWSFVKTFAYPPGANGTEPRAITFAQSDQRVLAGGTGFQGWVVATAKSGGSIPFKFSILACAKLDDRWVVAGGGEPRQEGHIWLCDVQKTAVQQELRAHGDRLRAIGVNMRKSVVITGAADGSIRTWNVKR
jgi:WD40 repeat protein